MNYDTTYNHSAKPLTVKQQERLRKTRENNAEKLLQKRLAHGRIGK